MLSLASVHKDEFSSALAPVAPPPEAVDDKAVLVRHERETLAGFRSSGALSAEWPKRALIRPPRKRSSERSSSGEIVATAEEALAVAPAW